MLALALSLALRAAIAAGEPAGEPAGLELSWDAPPHCPDRATLLAAIDATLGEVEGERRPLRVHGRVHADPRAGFVVRLELDDGRASTRELRGTSCEELTDAAALVIAMTIDPRLLESLQEPPAVPEPEVPGAEPSGPESSEPGSSEGTPAEGREGEPGDGGASDASSAEGGAARAPGDPPASEAPSTRERSSLRFLGRAQAGIGGGPLPGAAAVLGLVAGLGGRGWRAELSASYWTPRTRASVANPAVGVRAQLWALGVHGCGEPRRRRLSFPLCAGVLAGAVHARGVGELESRSIASRWVAVALEPGLVWWARPRLGLSLRAEGHAVLARPMLRSEPSGTVFTSGPVGGSLRAGLELRMP